MQKLDNLILRNILIKFEEEKHIIYVQEKNLIFVYMEFYFSSNWPIKIKWKVKIMI